MRFKATEAFFHLPYPAVFIISSALFLFGAHAQTTNVIPANEAAAHVNEWATVEGVVAKAFTSKKR